MLWRKAVIVEENPLSTPKQREEAKILRDDAAELRRRAEQKLGVINADISFSAADNEEAQYNAVVPGFFQ